MKIAALVALAVVTVALLVGVARFTVTPSAEAQSVTTSIFASKKATGFKVVKPDRTIFGVQGAICVTNDGKAATQSLKIVDQVQYAPEGGEFRDVPGATFTIIPAVQLNPGESKCYQYDVRFTPPADAFKYENTARVTITNFTGHLGEEFGPLLRAAFVLP
ncbi:MAG: hypothetical protein QN131_03700 [Armatimonadota bacterium]|nr:hypothetical protein [Armatimonadota bacterium]MDR7549027.1 hypothetical protein [Armatimonadota bacterium]